MRRVGVLMACAAVLLAGCRVDARVDVALKPDGSGTITQTMTLDAEAISRLGGTAALVSTVPVGDLRAAAWHVSGWAPAPGGGATISFTHPFANQDQLVARVVDIAGANGVLRDAKITRDRGWFSSADGIALTVDLRAPSAGVLTDTALAQRLRAAGVDPATLQARLSAELRTALHVTVVVHLPGGQTKTVDTASGQVTTVRVVKDSTNWDRIVKVGIALVLLLIGGMFLLASAIGLHRDHRRKQERLRTARIEPERTPLM